VIPRQRAATASGRPVLQLAVDGRWEDAVVVPLPADAVAVRAALAGLEGGAPAIEVLWPGPPVVFVGARPRDVGRAAECLAAPMPPTAGAAFALLSEGVAGPPVRAELGAVNVWRSVGPLAVPLDADADEVEKRLRGRPDLAAGCRFLVALEVVHAGAHESWWAVQVSTPTARGHVVDAAAVAEALAAVERR